MRRMRGSSWEVSAGFDQDRESAIAEQLHTHSFIK
jgi:hypothetical protein